MLNYNKDKAYINELRDTLLNSGLTPDSKSILKTLIAAEEIFNTDENVSVEIFFKILNKQLDNKKELAIQESLYHITKNIFDNKPSANEKDALLERKYNLVQEIIYKSNQKGFALETPKRLFGLLILKNKLNSNVKILFPEVKSGGMLIESIYYLASQNTQDIISTYSNITAFSLSSDTSEFVGLATRFIFGVEYSLRNEDFLDAVIHDNFDVVICNPPFGRSVKIFNDNFKLSKFRKNTPSELYFLEKIHSVMAINAIVSVVLPNNILENIINQDARNWISTSFKITEIISLYIGAFKPMTNIKTSILILEKKSEVCPNYNVKLSIISNEDDLLCNQKSSFELPIKDLIDINYSPEFYQRQTSSFLLELEQFEVKTIKEITKQVLKEKAKILRDASQSFRYVDLSSVDAKTGEIKEAKDIKVSEAPKRAYYEISKDDILVAVSGGGIGAKSHVIGVVGIEYDKCVCSNGFRVLKLNEGINPYYVWYFMRSEYFLEQVKQFSAGSTIPNLRENDLMNMKIFLPSLEVQNKIETEVKKYIEKLKEAELFLNFSEQHLKKIMKGGL